MMRAQRCFSLLSALALSVMQSLSAAPVRQNGTVVHVADGDTVTVLIAGNQQLTVRLASIDAPEEDHEDKARGKIGQPYSAKSKQYLSSLVKGKSVEALCFESDKYGRSVCEIFSDGQSVNRAMVASGWAWANQSARGRYLRDKTLPALEATARQNRAGLWAGKSPPTAPWEWRDVCWKQGRCAQ